MIKEQLVKVLNNKLEDPNNFIWKGEKIIFGQGTIQEEIKLMDAEPEDLNKFYNYCNVMLYNDDYNNLGRYKILNIIKEQLLKCRVELCLRTLEQDEENPIPKYMLNLQIQELLSRGENKNISLEHVKFGDITKNIPYEYKDLPVTEIIDGCTDKLGTFNRKYLKLAFILKQGIWLTEQEKKELTEYNSDGTEKNKIDVIREIFNINKNIKFNVNPKGLSYAQFRAAYNLKNKKYSELTTEQLLVLRNKILFNLETEINYHIKQWEKRKSQIEIVCKLRNIDLSC